MGRPWARGTIQVAHEEVRLGRTWSFKLSGGNLSGSFYCSSCEDVQQILHVPIFFQPLGPSIDHRCGTRCAGGDWSTNKKDRLWHDADPHGGCSGAIGYAADPCDLDFDLVSSTYFI